MVSIEVMINVKGWPYLDIVSARSGDGHLLSLVRRCSTLCQMIYEIPQSAYHSDSRRRHTFFLPISTFSALGVFHVMCYINVWYLLTYLRFVVWWVCCFVEIISSSCVVVFMNVASVTCQTLIYVYLWASSYAIWLLIDGQFSFAKCFSYCM